MKLIRHSLLLAVTTLVGAGIPLAGSAADADDTVTTLLEQGESEASIVRELISQGYNVDEATAAGVSNATSSSNRINFARAGVCFARDGLEAEQVRSAAFDAAGGAAETEELQSALAAFDRGSCGEFGINALPPGLEAANNQPSAAAVSRTAAGGGSDGDGFPGDVSPAN